MNWNFRSIRRAKDCAIPVPLRGKWSIWCIAVGVWTRAIVHDSAKSPRKWKTMRRQLCDAAAAQRDSNRRAMKAPASSSWRWTMLTSSLSSMAGIVFNLWTLSCRIDDLIIFWAIKPNFSPILPKIWIQNFFFFFNFDLEKQISDQF